MSNNLPLEAILLRYTYIQTRQFKLYTMIHIYAFFFLSLS